MSVWKKTMFYLGLGPEEEYENAPAPVGMTPEQSFAPPGDTSLTGAPVATVATVATVAPVAPVQTSASMSEPDSYTEPSAVRPLGPMESGSMPPLSAVSSVEPLEAAPSEPPVGVAPAAPAPAPTNSGSGINTVRALPVEPGSVDRPHVVGPRSFNDAQEVADRFKGGVPVIMNLQGVDRDLSRRLIDFASGTCYALSGRMEKVADRVYLLAPAGVQLSAEARNELHEQGLHNG